MPTNGNIYYCGRKDQKHIIRIDDRTFQIVAVNKVEAIQIAIQANQR